MQTQARWAVSEYKASPELLIPDTLLWLSPPSPHTSLSGLHVYSLPRKSLEAQALGGNQPSLLPGSLDTSRQCLPAAAGEQAGRGRGSWCLTAQPGTGGPARLC